MNRYVKVRFNGNTTGFRLYVDHKHKWSDEQIRSENAKAVEIAKMAFLDHGQPLIPEDMISSVEDTKAGYINSVKEGDVLLVAESGHFMPLLPEMEIVEEVYSEFYPIEEGAAIACENDPMDKWNGMMDHAFISMAKLGGADSFHYMSSFRNRTEEEIIHAFKNTPAIIFYSSHTEVDWWELMIRCIIKSRTKARVIGKRGTKKAAERFDKCVEMAKEFGVDVIAF